MQVFKAIPVATYKLTHKSPNSPSRSKRLSTMAMRNIILLTTNVNKSRKFYCDVLGSMLLTETESTAEIQAGSTSLILKASHNVAALSTGYSPILTFDVKGMEDIVQRAIAHGATLDGPIKYPAHGKVNIHLFPYAHMRALC